MRAVKPADVSAGSLDDERFRVGYILSSSYSGSTLLTLLLASHPGIATIGELKAQSLGDLDSYWCSCGELLRACRFWRRFREVCVRLGLPGDPGDFQTHFRVRSRPWLDRVMRARVRARSFELVRELILGFTPGAVSRIVEQNRRLIGAVLDLQRAMVFVDGSKDPVRLKYFARSGFFDLRVIHLIRDGRGVASSFAKHEGLTIDAAAREWHSTHAECLRALEYVPRTSAMTLHYESLCGDAEGTLDRVFAFLGLPPRERNGPNNVEHHILGNGMRLSFPGRVSLDEKWRSSLSQRDLATFDRVAGALNSRLGYR